MQLEMWNNRIFSYDVQGETIINAYHCANNGWGNVFKVDTAKWGIMNLKNFNIISNFDYTNPVNYYYPLIAAVEIYLATMGALEDPNSLFFSIPRSLTSLYKAVVVVSTDTY